jgi:hypothetical protein
MSLSLSARNCVCRIKSNYQSVPQQLKDKRLFKDTQYPFIVER